jgi:D-glycero-alpha-D-manno-heptose-7-phosphate kinase
MKRIIVRAPVRADLAGGTLDLWPLYLFHPGSRTVNVAISYHAESDVSETGDGQIHIELTDQQYRRSYASIAELSADPKAALLARLLEHFRLTGLRIVTRTDAPRGSGLGGSSALSVTLVRALSELAGKPVEGEELIALVRDLETRLLGIPAGIQDYYPPVFGGLSSLHLEPGQVTRVPLALPVSELAQHFVLHYSGIAHFSGTNNWELYKRQIDKKKKVEEGLSRIAHSAMRMERALEALNLEEAGAALDEEWQNRKALIDGISTPEIDTAIDAARKAGAWGGKVCGAGGGGCIVFLMPADRREAVVRSLAAVPGKVVEAVPVAYGLTVETPDVQQVSFTFGRSRVRERRSEETLEQLFVAGGTGDYHPFVLAEGIVTQNDSRSGVHHSVSRTYVAPMDSEDGRVLWHQGFRLEPETLELRAVPDPKRRLDVTASQEALMQGAIQAEEAFRQMLVETERIHIFYNPAFGIYSEPNETRESFVTRCLEEARRRVDNEAERLESTFRRRIDQLRERSEREQRVLDDSDDGRSDERPQDINVAWGQTLYNITSGRPATTDTPHSMREVDYMENIAQIQRAWDKELDTLRDELTARARSVEESVLTPTPRNIEVTKYMILWANELAR